jgi:hypothetical protein
MEEAAAKQETDSSTEETHFQMKRLVEKEEGR